MNNQAVDRGGEYRRLEVKPEWASLFTDDAPTLVPAP